MKIALFVGIAIYLLNMLFVDSYFMNIISVVFLFYFIFYLIKNENEFTLASLFFLWGFGIVAVICCIAEFGGYFSEIEKYSYLTGATARNTILAFFTLFSAAVVFKFLKRNKMVIYSMPKQLTAVESQFCITLYTGIIIILFMIRFVYGHPNHYGIDRFAYWNNIAPAWGLKLKYVAETLSIILGLNYALTKKKRYAIIFILGIISFYSVGDKFTSMFLSLVLFFTPIFIFAEKKIIDIILNIKFIAAFVFMMIVFCVITYFSYLNMIHDPDEAYKMVLYRLMLQAQMWWGIDQISPTFPQSLDIIWEHYLGVGEPNETRGIYYLMKFVSPAYRFNRMLENGITFTMAYPVTNIYFFGYALSIIPTIFLGGFLGLFFYIFHHAIKIGDPLLLIVVVILNFSLAQIFLMGNLYFIGSLRFIFTIGIIIIYMIISSGFKKHNV